MHNKKKIIIVGGGFGGLSAAKGLSNSEFEVLLFDKKNHHLFQPLLYQVASAALSPGDIAAPIREVLSQSKNITVLMDEIKSIRGDKNEIETQSGKIYNYDFLILAVGAKHSYFSHPEWEKFAPGLKTLSDALHIRNNLLRRFEEAEKKSQPSDQVINLVVIGGGPTGVEMAGALAEISKQTLANDFRNIDSSQTKIYLIEGASQILGMYPPALAQKAQTYLENLGVTVLLNSAVSKITADSVETKDQIISTTNIIWAAGNNASPLLAQLNTELDRAGRALVNGNLSCKKYSNIFVIGDAACFKSKNGAILPGLAPVATQQGKYLANYLKNNIKGDFVYLDKGSMATIGKFKAVFSHGNVQMAGITAWFMWCFVHILFLIDFRNKVLVFTQWALSFLFSKRGVRIIVETEDLAPRSQSH